MAVYTIGKSPKSFMKSWLPALESRPENDFTLKLVKGKLIDEFKRRKGTKDSREYLQGAETVIKIDFRSLVIIKVTV